jgi:hypothetical protein
MTKLTAATKDDLVLAMLAVLGGENREINERDLFLACWHAFPNTMRWVDTALPNPDTFTASLRRLDQRGYIQRVGKQQRQRKGRRPKTPLDSARSGVVKARVADGGLEKAEVGSELVEQVRGLLPDRDVSRSAPPGILIALCVGLRESGGLHLDEGVLAELAFHKFPDRFAYVQRREFPDLELIRAAIRGAQENALIDERYALTEKGRVAVHEWRDKIQLRLDASQAHEVGDLRFAARIEHSSAYQDYMGSGTLVRTKPDELFRALRVPPTTDPRPVAEALVLRVKALRRIDKGQIAEYLVELARRHNEEVAVLLERDRDEASNQKSAADTSRVRGSGEQHDR